MSKKKEGWQYFKSEALNQEFALHEETGWVAFADGVRYSPDEINILHEGGISIDRALHNVKLILGGEIIRYETRTSNNIAGENSPDNRDTGRKVSETTENGDRDENGDLFIY